MQSDGSYVTTKWFVFLFLPIVPIASYRVLENKVQGTIIPMQIDTKYHMVQVNLHRGQILRTYLQATMVFLIIALMVAGFVWYTS